MVGGGGNVIYTAISAICAASMNISKLSRVKYWGGPGSPAPPPVPTPMPIAAYCNIQTLVKHSWHD